MEEHKKKQIKHSVLKSVRKIKLAKNRKASDVFSCIDNKSAILALTRPFKKQPTDEQVKHKVNQKAENRKLRAASYKRFQENIRPEEAATIGKKRRRQFQKQYSQIEYEAFVQYINHCRKAAKRHRRRKKGKDKSERRSSYNIYINSAEWREVKNRYYQNYPRQCAACDTFSHIHLHHMSYGNFGHELDYELVPLCEPHHNDYHAKNGTQRNMLQRTKHYVTTVREAANLPSYQFLLPPMNAT
jgi:hypothetical protein